MNALTLRFCSACLALMTVTGLLAAPAAAPASDLNTPEKRRATVELAQRLAHPPAPAPLTPGLVQPFNPSAFGQPDPEELRAIAAASAAAAAASAQSKPSTDREFLEVIAARVLPSGSVLLGGQQYLIFGKKRLQVGDRLTVSYDNSEYILELTAIERTTFTLRLNKDEITRPIKPAK